MRQRFKQHWRKVAVATVAGGLAIWLLLPLVIRCVPLPASLLSARPVDTEFLDRHGIPLRTIQSTNGLHGRIATLQEVPDSLVRATLAAEDKRFWQHHGVDWRASVRAAMGFIRNGRVVSGGSTISQQVIKLAEPRPRTLRTKFMETAQAMRLEQIWSKEQILAEYLNRLDYGNRRIGIAAAADFYFGKPPSDLSEAEAAFLAGLPQSPTRLNPHTHFDRAKKRQEWILQREREEDLLSADVVTRAKSQSLSLRPAHGAFRAPHFVDYVLQQNVEPTGSAIQTTLDLRLNDFVQRALNDKLAAIAKQNAKDGAVVVIENQTGNVLALVGSGNYFAPEDGQVNGALAPRSAGSTFKPFTYLLALERGATPASIVADVPAEFPTATGVFAPLNYDRHCYGPMRYRVALANSLNISAVRVLDSIGGPAVLRDRLQACGLGTLTNPPEYYGLGLTIGNAEARLLELANAYASIARMGEFKPVRLIAGNPGASRRVFDADSCFLIADMLSDNWARTLAFGANSSLRFDFPVACKTGTSSDFRDNWALGFTPEFTVGVWVGNFDGSPMREVSGVSGAAPVLHEVFEELHAQLGTSWFATPSNIVERWVNPISGKLVAAGSPDAVREKFIAGKLPPVASADDYNAQGRVKLPAEYREWLASGQSWLANKAVVANQTAATPRIVTPLPGTTYFLDPDLPESGSRLRLRAGDSAEVEWRSDSLEIQHRDGNSFAILSEGRHELTAREPKSGAELRTWILVKRL
ncbi:MAG: penicillin-binding protein [Verrucomicrobiota bacterium]